MTLAALSTLAYAGVLAYAVLRKPALAPLTLTIGGLGAGAYVLSLLVHGASVDEAAPLVAVVLLVCGELAAWSLDERGHIACERGLQATRAIALAGLALCALGAATLVVALAAVSVGRGLGWTVAGAAAAVLVVALAARLSR